ncbi:hypothetical protein E2562_032662 [Oryza meyeriana var. granulata]|uniref:Uncharacterized protein n=1 Tax=Oryza meyeriana var. granulata TaxID=110450 RepID=A0A6G1FF09_9ORYZ|nr:hypothetical protein E2562_032662 [Oryza meyeriana var. granulata]
MVEEEAMGLGAEAMGKEGGVMMLGAAGKDRSDNVCSTQLSNEEHMGSMFEPVQQPGVGGRAVVLTLPKLSPPFSKKTTTDAG